MSRVVKIPGYMVKLACFNWRRRSFVAIPRAIIFKFRSRDHSCAVPREPGLGSFVFFSEDFEMSEYVEARYAKLVLREARGADEAEASRLVHDLLRDLAPPRASNAARAQAMTSIRVLALSLDEPESRHAREWEAADQATEAWCCNAYL